MGKSQLLALVGILTVVTATNGRTASSNEYVDLRAACEILAKQPLEKQASETVLNTARNATNSEIRCRAMAISTLAAILQDDHSGYSRCLAALNSTFPRSSLSLHAQPGSLSENCPFCDGSGWGMCSCTYCNGKGTCVGCQGSGQVTRFQFDGPNYLAECPNCEGTGRCKYCQGKGKVQTTCQNCWGRRQVLSKSKARTAYLQAINETAIFCYSSIHPEIKQVETAIQTAKADDDLNTGIAVLQNVMQLYPQADNINSAKAMLALLQEKQKAEARIAQEQRLQLKAARESSNLTNAFESVQTFIKTHPDSPCISEAKALLLELQAKKELVNSTGL